MRILLALLFLISASGNWVYYKVASGPVYGPFADEQLVQWEKAGHFRGHDLKVSTSSEPNTFVPFDEYLYEYHAGKKVGTKSGKSKILTLSSLLKKKLSTAMKLGKNVRAMATLGAGGSVRFPDHTYATKGYQRTELYVQDENGHVGSFGPHQQHDVDTEPVDPLATPETSETSDSSVDAEVTDSTWLAVQSEAPQQHDDSEEELLKQLKRDSPQIMSPEPLSGWRRAASSSPRGTPRSEKYSVKSLAKESMSLWSEEEGGSYSSVIARTPAGESRVGPSVITSAARYLGHTGEQVLTAVSRLLPVPLGDSAGYIGTLATSSEGRIVLLYMVLDLAWKVLQLHLFLLLLSSTLELSAHISVADGRSGIVKLGPGIVSAAGGISSSVLTDAPRPLPLAVSGVLRADFLRLMRTLQTCTMRALHTARHADMHAAREAALRAHQLVMQSGAAVLRVLASADQATVRSSVVLAALLALSVVIRPAIAWGMLGAPSSNIISGEKVGIAHLPAAIGVRHVETCVFSIARIALAGVAVLALCAVGRGKGNAGEEIVAGTLLVPWAVSLAGACVELYCADSSPAGEAAQDVAVRSSSNDAVDLSARRCSSLSNMLSDARAVEECRRAGLLAYAQDLLRGELRTLTTSAGQSHRRSSRGAQRHGRAVRYARRSLAGLTIILASMWGWVTISQAAQSGDVDVLGAWSRLLLTLQDAVPDALYKQPQTCALAKTLGELLPHTEVAVPPLRFGRSVASELKTWLLPFVALALPSLFYLQQLAAIDGMERSAALLRFDTAARDVNRSQAVESSTRAVRTAEHVLRNVKLASPDYNAERTAMSAEKALLGIEVDHLVVEVDGEPMPKTLSLRVHPGRITAIVCGSATELHAADALLAVLAGAEETPGAVIRGVQNLRVFGDAIEQNGGTAYFSGREAQLPMQAGAVAGYLPGATGNDLRRALRTQVAAGAHSIIAALPSGPATFLKTSHHERVDMSDAELTSDQWRTLHLSRALSQCDRDVVLLAQPTRGMTAAQERLFFQFLKESLRPGQIVLLTSDKASTAAFVDEVKHINQSGGVVVGAANDAEDSAPEAREIGNDT